MSVGRISAAATLAFVALSAAAQAAPPKFIEFKGVVAPGATGSTHTVGLFCDEDPACGTVSFTGQPITIDMALSKTSTGYYASATDVNWSNETYSLHYLTSWSDEGFAVGSNPPFDAMGLFSSLHIDFMGGSSSQTSTQAEIIAGREFSLAFDFTFDEPQIPFAIASDVSILGSGQFDGWSSYGPAELHSAGGFILTSVSVSTTPEPATWALMILGFGAAGAILRRRGQDGRQAPAARV